MSIDVFFQRFTRGESVGGGNAEARRILSSHLVRDDSQHVTGLVCAGGGAELFGLDNDSGFMATHIAGTVVWDLLFEAAEAAGFTVMPVGCPVCIVDDELKADLPEELAHEGVRTIRSGTDLREVVAAGR